LDIHVWKEGRKEARKEGRKEGSEERRRKERSFWRQESIYLSTDFLFRRLITILQKGANEKEGRSILGGFWARTPAILEGFGSLLGRFFEIFWHLFGYRFRSSILGGFSARTPAILEGFGGLLGRLEASWGGFRKYFAIFLGYSFRSGCSQALQMNFDGFWYLVEEQK
jgi:hypothetical protein